MSFEPTSETQKLPFRRSCADATDTTTSDSTKAITLVTDTQSILLMLQPLFVSRPSEAADQGSRFFSPLAGLSNLPALVEHVAYEALHARTGWHFQPAPPREMLTLGSGNRLV